MNSYNSTSSNPSVAAPLRVGRPWIRTTFQLHSRITIESHSAEDAFLQARKTPIFWVKDKIQAWLPQEAWEGNSFRVEVPGGGSSVEGRSGRRQLERRSSDYYGYGPSETVCEGASDALMCASSQEP